MFPPTAVTGTMSLRIASSMEVFLPLSRILRPDAAWFVRQREIVPEAPERVWRAITEPEELALWWCERAELNLRAGGHYAFGGRFVYGDDPSLPRERFEILDLEDGARIEYRWPLRGVDTKVLVEVAGILEETEVIVTQTAGAAPSWAPAEGEPHWWSVALPGLRSYIERGRADLRPDYPALRASAEPSFSVDVTTFPWMVWRKLTEPGELRRWLSREARVDPVPGGVFDLGPGAGPRRILDLVPEKLLVFDWHEPGGPPGRVSFQIEETDEASRVTLTDHGPHPPGESNDARDRRILRWLCAILHLKQLSERGMTPREYQEG